MRITTIGLDLAKNIFQVHAVTADGQIVFNKALRRAQLLPFFTKLEPCLVGVEACGTSHYWARELGKLGHEVKLMPPIYVKPYVKRGKTDANDAQAICEAVTRPTMRFVAIKSPEQQALLCQHRARALLIGQRTQICNTIRGLIGEFGITIRKGMNHVRDFADALQKGDGPSLPNMAQEIIYLLCDQLLELHHRIQHIDKLMVQAATQDYFLASLRARI